MKFFKADKLCFLLVLLVLVLVLGIQNASGEITIGEIKSGEIAETGNARPVIVVDAEGNELRLDKPAERVISLAPHLTEQVFDAGGGGKLVAVVSYSDFPEAAKQLPQVGTYKKISYETVVSLQPDLVLAFGGNGHAMVNRLRQLGFKVFVEEPRELDDVATSLENIGKLIGTSTQADRVAADFRQRYQQLQRQNQGQDEVPVFYQVWDEPLLSINGKHLISSVIDLCGGKNIFSDAIPMAPKVSVEMVIRRDPMAIIASGHGEAKPEWLDNWKKHQTISAVSNGHLYHIPPDILQRHTTRILQGAGQMCDYLQQVRKGNKFE